MIPLYRPHIPDDALRLIRDVIQGTVIADGPYVREFEAGMAEYLGNPCVVTMGDVSSAIQACLMAAGIGEGDEVMASPMACVATNQPVVLCGATVRWCDVDSQTGLMDAGLLDKAVSSRSKAVLVPLWAGDVPELEEVYTFAGERGLVVIEDAGEALGSRYRDRMVGNTGADFTVFSFHAIRHITTGEGAAVCMRDGAAVERLNAIKRYAIDRSKFRDSLGEIDPACDIAECGLNSYMTNIAGAIGVSQLNRLEEVVCRHRENGLWYDEHLEGIDGLKLCPRPAHRGSSYWVYTVLAEQRDDLMKALRGRGVYASKVHYRNDRYKCFAVNGQALPGTDHFSDHQLCLPCGWWVGRDEREQVKSAIMQGW